MLYPIEICPKMKKQEMTSIFMLDDEPSNDFVLPLAMSELPYDAVHQSEVLTVTDDCLTSTFSSFSWETDVFHAMISDDMIWGTLCSSLMPCMIPGYCVHFTLFCHITWGGQYVYAHCINKILSAIAFIRVSGKMRNQNISLSREVRRQLAKAIRMTFCSQN